MGSPRAGRLRVGDRVRLSGRQWQVDGLDGTIAYLTAPGQAPLTITVTALVADPSFQAASDSARRRPQGRLALMEQLPEPARARASWWESHLSEVLDGVPCDAADGARPRDGFDPASTTLRARERAKTAELQAAGEQVSLRGLQRLRRAYETQGVVGLVDKRPLRRDRVAGTVDERVVVALQAVLAAQSGKSTGTMARIWRDTVAALEAEHGPDVVPLPSRATIYRLIGKLREGRHALGSARTRRTLAQQPARAFGQITATRPGEWTQIDSTPLDIAVVLADGVIGRVELTVLADVASRSICAAVLRPSTRAVDAALLLARALTPEPMRPGWPEAISMAYSVLPFQALRSIDQRLEAAAGKPVIVPETIVFDHGVIYLSATFRAACRSLGISLQPAHPDTPTDKPHIERTLGSIATLFAQYVAGYLGSSVERRGQHAESQAVFSLVELQDLLDEWIITGWQNRPHEGLRDPLSPGQVLTPNEKYAALLNVAGYVPVPLSGQDFIELLPMKKRTINSYGIRIDHRIYDGDDLNPYRGQRSGVTALDHKWEVHYDPYDVTRVWVRNHWDGGWITVYWRYLASAPVPFGDTAWAHARSVVAARGDGAPSEQEIAAAVGDLLGRASTPDDHDRVQGQGQGHGGPDVGAQTARRKKTKTARDRRIAARTRATTPPTWPHPPADPPAPSTDPMSAGPHPGEQEPDDPDPDIADEQVADVIPLAVYDAREEAKKWW